MSAAVAEGFPFDPEADYRQTLADLTVTFNANLANAFDNDNGQVVLAGTAAARKDLLSALEVTNEATIEVVIVRVAQGEGPNVRYRYSLSGQPYDVNGERVGTTVEGEYSTLPAEADWTDRWETVGVMHRNLLEATRFDPLASNLAALSAMEVGGGVLATGVEAGVEADRRNIARLRHPRLGSLLGFLSLRRRPKRGE